MSRHAEWDAGVVNRNKYIVEELIRSGRIRKILHVEGFPVTFKRLLRIWKDDIFLSRIHARVANNFLSHVSEIQKEKEWIFSSIEPFFSEHRFCTTLRSLINELSFQKILLWSYIPTYTRVFSLDVFQKKVFDAVDDWSVHPSYAMFRDRIQRNYQCIREKADVIFTVSQEMHKTFNSEKAHWIPNGVDLERYPLVEHRTDKRKNPLIVYIGVIQQRVDIPLLTWIAKQRPQYSFRIIGPVWKGVNVQSLRRCANVEMVGFRPSLEIPELVRGASAGIVPHRTQQFVQSMNPMKIYEYLAMGIPVVTTTIPDFQRFAYGVRESRTRESFLQNLDTVITLPLDRMRLRHAVSDCTWIARVQEMWRYIDG
jgi:glycosyltransferase involved in cell wall biosynthesis